MLRCIFDQQRYTILMLNGWSDKKSRYVLIHNKINLIFAPVFRKEDQSGCSAVRLAHLLWEQGVASSNPATPTLKIKHLSEISGRCFFVSCSRFIDLSRNLVTKIMVDYSAIPKQDIGLCPSNIFWSGFGVDLEGYGRGTSPVLAESFLSRPEKGYTMCV